MDLTYIYTCLSEWTAYLDDPADLCQNLPGSPVLQPGLQSGLQMSNLL